MVRWTGSLECAPEILGLRHIISWLILLAAGGCGAFSAVGMMWAVARLRGHSASKEATLELYQHGFRIDHGRQLSYSQVVDLGLEKRAVRIRYVEYQGTREVVRESRIRLTRDSASTAHAYLTEKSKTARQVSAEQAMTVGSVVAAARDSSRSRGS